MIIFGKNSVKEFIENSIQDVIKVYISKDIKKNQLQDINKIADLNSIPTEFVDKNSLFTLTNSENHQGFAAEIKDFSYTQFNKLIDNKPINNNKFLLILDHIEDPHNLGAIIRTSNFLGVDGIIIPNDRAASVNPTVIKVSSGAVSSIPIARVSNLNRVISDLKQNNFWIIGSDSNSKKEVSEIDVANLDLALVIGNEGRGMSQKIQEKCDFLVSIPKNGTVDSLNASVAAGILIYSLIKIS